MRKKKRPTLEERLKGVREDGTPEFPENSDEVRKVLRKLRVISNGKKMETPSCLLPPLF